tara:strand:+ start:178 stop:459 length:282 start_codon:yes stop_codon:yes gene_type:complete
MNGRLSGNVVLFVNGCSTLSKLPRKYDNFIIRKIVGSPVAGAVKTIRVSQDGAEVFFTVESCGQRAEVGRPLGVLLEQWGRSSVVADGAKAIE